jgi:hypothetical protein
METKPPPYKVRCIPCNKSIDSSTPETICPRCKRQLSCHINPLGIQHDSRIMKPDPKPQVNPQVKVPDGNPKNIAFTIFFVILIIKFFPMIPAVIIALAIIIGVPLLLIVLPLLFLVYAASMANDVANIATVISKHKKR